MAAARKLMAEIDRTLKKVAEGVDTFDAIWEKVYSANTQALKEKFEADLKKEIKRLQRYRDQCKTWAASNDIKDKAPLVDARKLVETRMERFKECERETKTKAYSREGLARSAELDPAQVERNKARKFLQQCISTLEDQVDSCEAELERMSAARRPDRSSMRKLDETLENHKFHIEKMEMLQRMLDNERITAEDVEGLKDDIEYYLESNREDDFMPDLEIYEAIEEALGVSADASTPSAISAAASAGAGAGAGSASTSGKKGKAAAKPTTKAAAKAAASATTTGKGTVSAKAGASGKAGATAAAPAAAAGKGTSGSKGKAAATSGAAAKTTPAAAAKGRKGAAAVTTSGKGAATAAPARVNTPKPGVSMANIVKGNTTPLTNTRGPGAQRVQQSPATAAAAVRVSQAPAATPAGTASVPPAAGRAPPASQAVSRVPLSPGTGTAPNAASHPATGAPASAAAVSAAATSAAAAAAAAAAAVASSSAAPAAAPAASAAAPPPAPVAPVEPVPIMRPAELQRNLALLQSSLTHIPEARDSERPKLYTPRNPYQTHASFPDTPLPSLHSSAAFEKLDTDTLFFAFYYQQNTYQQYLAARELKKQSWRFHKKYNTWFQRHEEPKQTTNEFECGTYVYFDYETGWCQRIKREFRFEYSYLEDELPSPPSASSAVPPS